MRAVEARQLTKIYPGGVKGVDNLSFSVEDGEIYGLIGPNGSGKTTTLRILATILKPTSGTAQIYGYDVIRNPLSVRRLISYLPEEAGAYRDLRGIDFLKFIVGLRYEGVEQEKIVEEAVKLSKLGGFLKKPVRTYSKGMRRALAFAAALAIKPRLAILDEPTAGLDVERSLEIRNTILKYNKEYGVTVLLSSHNMLEVEYLCTRVGIIYHGRIIVEGYVEDLKREYDARNLEEVFIKAVEGVRAQ